MTIHVPAYVKSTLLHHDKGPLALIALSNEFHGGYYEFCVPLGSMVLGQSLEITISNEVKITQGETK